MLKKMEEMKWMADYGSGAFNNTTLLHPEDNSTLSCAARSIQGLGYPPLPDALVLTVRVCQSIFLFLAGSIAFFLNIFLMSLVAKYKKLQTLAFGIVIQSASLTTVGSLIFFTGVANCIAGRWVYGEHICRVTGALSMSIGAVRALLLLNFVIDRFLTVFLPFKYPKHRKMVVTILSLAAWSVLPVSSIVMNVLDCVAFCPSFGLCSLRFTCSRNCKVVADVLYALLAPAFIIPVLLYTFLFMKAKKARKAMANKDGKQAYNWKATITFFLMFVASFLFTMPTVITEFLIQIAYSQDRHSPVPFVLSVISRSLITFLPATDAIIILRNPDVREVVKDVKKRFSWKLSNYR